MDCLGGSRGVFLSGMTTWRTGNGKSKRRFPSGMTTREATATARAMVKAGAWGGDARVVVIAPSAGWGAKEWPVERFGKVAARLSLAGLRVLVNADGSGNEKAEAVVRASGGAAVAVPCTIAELIALLRRASLFVGGDTGPMHLADALGVPVVALFGPTDPARNGPYGDAARVRVLRRGESVTDHRRHRETEIGLGRISVDEVMEAALELLRKL